MKPTIQLIATDIDDTLMPYGKVIPPENIAALQAAHKRGIRIVLATIRKRDSTELLGDMLAVPYAMICQGGATIYDTDGRCLHEASIELEHARSIAAYADAHGIAMVTTIAEHNYYVGNAERRLNVAHKGTLVANNLDALYAAPSRILTHGAQQAQMLIDMFATLPLCFVRHYHSGMLQDVVITAQTATKQQALTMLCAHWGMAAANVLALGDSESDIGMLQMAGIGVAMGNARSDVRAVADWVAPPSAEAGLAAALGRFCL